jgi:hypothetical protein
MNLSDKAIFAISADDLRIVCNALRYRLDQNNLTHPELRQKYHIVYRNLFLALSDFEDRQKENALS